jgi:glycosyltransferase involved in cell wall biosynthesis
MTSPTVTAAIIVQNEADHLRQLLPRLIWADETLVVDGGSSDEGVAIARSFGAKVVERPFDDFASQRNAALDAAVGDWVLFVDADERPGPTLADEIRRRIEHIACDGYRVPIRSSIFGRPFRFSGTQNDAPLRLVRRGASRWHGAVHETCSVAGAVGRLEAWLDHEGLPDVATFLAKMERYTTLAATARVADRPPPRLRDAWLRPPLEIFRRLCWKQGWLDGPEGWSFAMLSGLSEWVAATKHRRLWKRLQAEAAPPLVSRRTLVEGATA